MTRITPHDVHLRSQKTVQDVRVFPTCEPLLHKRNSTAHCAHKHTIDQHSRLQLTQRAPRTCQSAKQRSTECEALAPGRTGTNHKGQSDDVLVLVAPHSASVKRRRTRTYGPVGCMHNAFSAVCTCGGRSCSCGGVTLLAFVCAPRSTQANATTYTHTQSYSTLTCSNV